jgi:hypothetical protein
VENILNIDASTDTTRITRALAAADDYINSRLAEAGEETVPLTTVPDIIAQIANTLAAGICKDELKNPSEETVDRVSGRNRLTNRAYEWLAQYLCSEYTYQCAQAATTPSDGGGETPSSVPGPDPVFYEQPIQ